MRQETQQRNRAIVRWTLIFILAADVILLGVNWRLSQAPMVPATELRRLELLGKQYQADTARLEGFRRELPADEKQWDDFFKSNFRSYASGYSAISGDLGDLSRTAGLHMDNITYHTHNPDTRGLVQVDIGTAVEGDYPSLINFLDKLEHSNNFYVLDSLTLASSSTSAGKIRLNLQLRTYFRT
jgi:hypothetical protein